MSCLASAGAGLIGAVAGSALTAWLTTRREKMERQRAAIADFLQTTSKIASAWESETYDIRKGGGLGSKQFSNGAFGIFADNKVKICTLAHITAARAMGTAVETLALRVTDRRIARFVDTLHEEVGALTVELQKIVPNQAELSPYEPLMIAENATDLLESAPTEGPLKASIDGLRELALQRLSPLHRTKHSPVSFP